MATASERFRARHQVWAELISAQGHIAWSDQWVTPFMSAWCIYQQYCHLNQVSGTELIEPIDLRDQWNQPYPRNPRSFLQADSWMPKPPNEVEKSTSAFYFFLSAMRTATLHRLIGFWMWSIASDSQIRYCPSCRSSGYQSIFDQVLGIERCPIHDQAYSSHCHACGDSLPAYRFDRTRDPIICPRCSVHLMPFDDRTCLELSSAFRKREAAAWLPLAEWCRHILLKTRYASRLKFPRRIDVDEPLSNEARCLWMLHEIHPLPSSIQPYLAPRRCTFLRVRIPLRHRAPIDQEYRQLCGEKAEDRKHVFKSIARYLRRRYLRQHSQCLRWVQGRFWVVSYGEKRVASRLAGGCRAAQAYVFWRQSFMRDNARRCNPPVLEMYSPSAENSDLRLWAHRVLCAFHERFIAMRLSYLLDERYEAKKKTMWASNQDVADFDERLALEDANLHFGSAFIRTSDEEVIVIGRPAHPDLHQICGPWDPFS